MLLATVQRLGATDMIHQCARHVEFGPCSLAGGDYATALRVDNADASPYFAVLPRKARPSRAWSNDGKFAA